MDIVGVKLKSGDEFFARSLPALGDTYVFEEPARPMVGPNGQLTLMIWNPFSDQKQWTFNKDEVSQIYPLRKEIEKIYMEATSGISIASGQQAKEILRG